MTRVFMLIDRYIIKMFLGFFLAGCVVFVTLFVAVDVMTNMMRFQPSTKALTEYYLYFTPSVLYLMIPAACLLGTIFTLSSLNKTNELVALFSSGMSLARISTPILLSVVLISAIAFWFNDRVAPILNQKKNYTLYVDIRKQPSLYSTVKTNKIWYRSNNILFNIKTLQAERAQAQGLTMYYFDGAWQLVQMLTAQEVALHGDTWELKKGTVTLFSKDNDLPMSQVFERKVISMGEDAGDLQSTAQTSESLSLRELRHFIQRNKEAGLETIRYEVDYHSKFGFAFAAFVMSFIGIPFSVSRQRSGGTAVNIGICVGLAFVYWAAYNSGITLGRHGALSPFAAAWIPNVLMIAVSTVLLVRLKR